MHTIIDIMNESKLKKLTIKEFSKAAQKYETDDVGIYNMCKKDYPDILKEIEKEDFETLLDAGCGTAPMISLLARKYPDKKYTGIDLTPEMIEVAKRKKLNNSEFVVGDCENLPFDENSFNVIICSMSAHHYPNLNNFYSSISRCLKPNGRFILRDMTCDNKGIEWLCNNIEMPLINILGKGDVRMLNRFDVQKGLQDNGLRVEVNEIRKGMRLHLVARKPR